MLGLAALLLWAFADQSRWAWRSDHWMAQPWTLWTASLVHLSTAHLIGNLAALAVLAALGAYLGATRRCVTALLVAWPVGTWALGLWPTVEGYGGLSGTLCAMVAILAVQAATHAALRPVCYVLSGSLAFKLLAEHGWSQPIAYDPAWGFNVVYAAHLSGALAGSIAATVLVWSERRDP